MTATPTASFEDIQLGLIGSTPRGTVTNEQKQALRLEQAEYREQVKPGFVQSVRDAMTSEFITDWLARRIALEEMNEYGSGFNPTEEQRKQLFEGIPEDLWGEFERTTSMNQAWALRDQLLTVEQARERLDSLGLTGVALRIGAQIIDPAALAAEVTTGGLAGPAFLAGKGTRLSRLARGGLVAAAPEVAIESTRAALDPQNDATDVLYAGLFAFAAGGSLNAVIGPKADRAMRRIEARDVLDHAMGAASQRELNRPLREILEEALTEDGKKHLKILDQEEQRAFLDDMIGASGLDPEDDADIIRALRGMDEEDVLHYMLYRERAHGPGAKETIGRTDPDVDPLPAGEGEAPPPPTKQANDFTARPTRSRAAMTGIRRSFASILGSSESANMRAAGSVYAEDALLRADGSPAPMSATRWAQMTYEAKVARFQRQFDGAFEDWKARTGKKSRSEFSAEIGKAKRVGPGVYSDPAIDKAVRAADELFADTLGIGKRHGVKGLDAVEHAKDYMPRIWSTQALSRTIAGIGLAPVEDLFATAIRNATPEIGQPTARKMAKGMIKTIVRSDELTDWEKARMIAGELPDELAEIMRSEGIGETTIRQTLFRAGKSTGDDKANITRAKHRVRMDENAAVQINGGTLRISDLLDNDIESVARTYTRQVVGASAATEVYRAMTPAGRAEPFGNFKQMSEWLIEDARSKGIAKEAIDRDIKLLDTLDKAVRHIPITPDSQFSRFGRRLRGVNYVLRSGTFGLAQVPEVTNVIVEGGFRNFIGQVPALGRIFTRARGGEMSDELIGEIEAIAGLGTDHVLARFFDRFDDLGAGLAERAAGRTDEAIDKAGRAASVASGLVHIDTATRRIAGVTGSQRLIRYALQGKAPSAKRAAMLGMTPDEMQRVMQSVRAEIDKGTIAFEDAGRTRLAKINLDQWEDIESATMFAQGLRRWADRVVQRNDIGQLHPYMTTDLGRTLFQFRTFHVASWEKQFLTRVQARDVMAASSAMFGMTIAGLIYTAQTYSRSIGRDDREEYLAERLSTEAIAKAAFQRGGASSLLPGIIDTTLPFAGIDPQFNYRNSGLSSGIAPGQFIDSTPAARLITDLSMALQGATTAARTDESFDQQDAAAFRRLAPFQNVLGVRQGLQWLENQFPERERDN